MTSNSGGTDARTILYAYSRFGGGMAIAEVVGETKSQYKCRMLDAQTAEPTTTEFRVTKRSMKEVGRDAYWSMLGQRSHGPQSLAEILEKNAAAKAKKKADQDAREVAHQARLEAAEAKLKGCPFTLVAEQPVNVYSVTFESSHDGTVTLMVAATEDTEWGWENGEPFERPCLSVSAASCECRDGKYVSFGSISGRKAKTIREGVISIIAGHYV